jgi:hypothetical protein
MWQIYRLAQYAGNRQIAAVGALVSLRIMARTAPDYSNDITVYLVEEDFGRNGRAYLETDAAEADRETIIRNFISGQYDTPMRVVAFNTAEGWSRDVSEDIAYEVLDQAYDADEVLTEGTKSFIDHHVTPGEKRPPAPSVRRGDDHLVRKKA